MEAEPLRNEAEKKPDPEGGDGAERRVADALGHVGRQALRGNFRAARRLLKRARTELSPADAERIDAQDRAFRLDRAVLIAFSVTGAVILVIAAMSLFH